jgi:hypothetical protein
MVKYKDNLHMVLDKISDECASGSSPGYISQVCNELRRNLT